MSKTPQLDIIEVKGSQVDAVAWKAPDRISIYAEFTNPIYLRHEEAKSLRDALDVALRELDEWRAQGVADFAGDNPF